MSKELKEIRRMIALQIENINKYLEIIKKQQNINSGVKNTTIVIVKKKRKKKGQQQIWAGGRKNYQT